MCIQQLEAASEEVRPVSADDPVLYEVRDSGVAVLTLNRPERMNGWGGGLAAKFYALLDQAEADPHVRAIVVTGAAGRSARAPTWATCRRSAKASTDGETDISKLVGERHPHFVATLRKPVIAAINGACAGIGLTQALMCDVRFAAAGAKFTTSFARRGLIAEYGISWILPRVVGWGAALDLLLSGRVFLADEAAELGLVKEVVAPEELLPRAIGYAEDIAANCAPSSLAVIKQQVYADTMRDVFEASDHAEKLMHESMQRPDFIEGITASSRSARRTSRRWATDLTAVPERTRHDAGLQGDRRRQPLLRAAGLLHPASAQGVQAPRRADGHATASAPWPSWATGQPLHPEPDVRPDHRAGLPGSAVPRRDPRRRRPGVADEGRPAWQTIPSTRTAMPGSR